MNIGYIEIPRFTKKQTVDVYYDGRYYSEMDVDTFNVLRTAIVKKSHELGIKGEQETGYTIKCYKDTDDENNLKKIEIIIYANGNLSDMPYEFSHTRRELRKIFDINNSK